MALLGFSAAGYMLIWRRAREPSTRALAAWQAGLLAIAVATCSPLDPLADVRFTAHMVQHELLTFLAAPLLVAGMRPLSLFVLPYLGPPVSRWAHAISRPHVTWVLSAVVLWAWHWPPAYDLALACPAVHNVEHAMLLGAYVLYWSPFGAFGHAVAPLRTGDARAFYLITGGIQSGLLAGLLAFSPGLLYTHYLVTGGLDAAVRDQQAGGMVMLLSGATVFAVAAVVTARAAP